MSTNIAHIKTLGQVRISATQRLVVDLDLIANVVKVQARIWYPTDEGWAPTKRGITMTPDQWAEMVQIIPSRADLATLCITESTSTRSLDDEQPVKGART